MPDLPHQSERYRSPRNGLRLLLLFLLCSAFWLPREARAAVDYEPHIVGVDDANLLDTLKSLSQLFALEDKAPDSVTALDQRARADLDRLRPALQGAGYWEAKLDYTIDEKAKPVSVTVAVRMGPLYRLAKVNLIAASGGAPPPLAAGDASAFGFTLGEPALTAAVVGAEPLIVERYAVEGRPFAKVTKRDVVLDRATKTMEVTYTVDAGPRVRFGPTTITGLTLLDAAYVERRIQWRRGAVYDSRLVDQTRKALVDSGLFASVTISPQRPQERSDSEDEPAPMTIAVVERARHSVGAGLYYDTSEGIGGRAFWEERNLFGNGENVRVQGEAAQQLFDGLARFTEPDVLATNQDWVSEAELAEEQPDPYDSRKVRLYSGLARHVDPQRDFGLGLQFITASVSQFALFDDVPSHVDYSLVGLPFFARFDQSNDKLSPTTGHRESISITPNVHVAGPTTNFAAIQGKASAYQPVDRDQRYVVAEYAALGSIVGAATEQLPADQRLYVGGSTSVRGFGYQRAGPLGSNNLPTGGASSLAFGAELRVKVTDTIGVVPFFDAGSAYRTIVPNPGDGLFYGAGIGGRYYTPVGPVRLDVAFPLNKRGSDSAFQLYISIGQAF